MNQEQVKSAARSMILFIAGIVGGVGVSKGWYTAERLASVLNSEIFASIVAGGITLGYGIVMNGKVRLRDAAAGVNPETTIIPPTKAEAEKSLAPNVVAPGSAAAKVAAKA